VLCGRLAEGEMIGHEREGVDLYHRAREAMVKHQLQARGISDSRVLEAMLHVRRELFIPASSRGSAYEDRALPIAMRQTISQPYMVALMTEKLKVKPSHNVLEIGTGCGYQTAILAGLAEHVYTVERIAELSAAARRTLGELGITNVTFEVGDGTLGWREFGPYDRIMVTAGAPDVGRTLVDQLVDGGIMIVPIGPEDSQTLVAVTREPGGGYSQQRLLACRFVKLLGKEGWPDD